MEELDINILPDEAILDMGIDELYATLGSQLLSLNLPTHAAGIVSYLKDWALSTRS